jgi:peptide chain release factor subunit 1
MMNKNSLVTITSDSKISPSEWFRINQFMHEIKKINIPCVSVYYPYGKGQEMISLLEETKRTESIEEIESAIEKRIQKLKNQPTSLGKFKKTLCIFGWIKNGKVNLKEIGTSKKLPYIYMLSNKPFLKPFVDILKIQQEVLLVILDQKTAKIQRFQGAQIIGEASMKIDLQGRHKKGGQSQGRFLRARQTKIHVFYKKIAKKIREMSLGVELILLGGAGQAKTEFFSEIDSELIQKCRFVENLSFSTPKSDVYTKIIDNLYQHRIKHVEEILEKYDRLVKKKLTERRNENILKALELGAVDTLIVSAIYYSEPNFKKIIKMMEIAKQTSSTIEFVTSSKIIQRLEIDDSVLAILRYSVN